MVACFADRAGRLSPGEADTGAKSRDDCEFWLVFAALTQALPLNQRHSIAKTRHSTKVFSVSIDG